MGRAGAAGDDGDGRRHDEGGRASAGASSTSTSPPFCIPVLSRFDHAVPVHVPEALRVGSARDWHAAFHPPHREHVECSHLGGAGGSHGQEEGHSHVHLRHELRVPAVHPFHARQLRDTGDIAAFHVRLLFRYNGECTKS